MRPLQIALLACILAALLANAWETRQLRRELAPFATLSRAAVHSLVVGPETPAEHDERIRAGMRRTMHDAQVMADEAFKPTPSVHPAARSTRPAPEQ